MVYLDRLVFMVVLLRYGESKMKLCKNCKWASDKEDPDYMRCNHPKNIKGINAGQFEGRKVTPRRSALAHIPVQLFPQMMRNRSDLPLVDHVIIDLDDRHDLQ